MYEQIENEVPPIGLQNFKQKSVYLDVRSTSSNSNTHNIVRHSLNVLGARVEPFFNDQINCVITDNGLWKLAQRNLLHNLQADRQRDQCIQSQELSKGPRVRQAFVSAIATSPSTNNPKRNDVVLRALDKSMEVVSLDSFMVCVDDLQERLKTSHSPNSTAFTTKLKMPFLKFESLTNKYRPVYKQFEEWPKALVVKAYNKVKKRKAIVVNTSKFCPFTVTTNAPLNNVVDSESPFVASGSINSLTTTLKPTKLDSVQGSYAEESNCTVEDAKVVKEKPRPAVAKTPAVVTRYCEICNANYNDLQQHLRSKVHREFVDDVGCYDALDELARKSGKVKVLSCYSPRHVEAASSPTESSLAGSDYCEINSTSQSASTELTHQTDGENNIYTSSPESNADLEFESPESPLNMSTKRMRTLSPHEDDAEEPMGIEHFAPLGTKRMLGMVVPPTEENNLKKIKK